MGLYNASIDDDGVVALSTGLCKNKTLEILNLSQNKFKQKGLTIISDILCNNTKLRTLCIIYKKALTKTILMMMGY